MILREEEALVGLSKDTLLDIKVAKNDESKYTDREKALMRLHNQQLTLNGEAFDELAKEHEKLIKELRVSRANYKELLDTKTTLKKVRKLESEVDTLKREKEWILNTVKEFARQLDKANG